MESQEEAREDELTARERGVIEHIISQWDDLDGEGEEELREFIARELLDLRLNAPLPIPASTPAPLDEATGEVLGSKNYWRKKYVALAERVNGGEFTFLSARPDGSANGPSSPSTPYHPGFFERLLGRFDR